MLFLCFFSPRFQNSGSRNSKTTWLSKHRHYSVGFIGISRDSRLALRYWHCVVKPRLAIPFRLKQGDVQSSSPLGLLPSRPVAVITACATCDTMAPIKALQRSRLKRKPPKSWMDIIDLPRNRCWLMSQNCYWRVQYERSLRWFCGRSVSMRFCNGFAGQICKLRSNMVAMWRS